MKKVLYMAASLLVCITILSCSKEEVGGTATESMAGQWYCTIDAVDENGNIITQALDGSPNNGYHSYEVSKPRDIPPQVLKQMYKDGKISKTEYNKYRKGKK